MEVVVVFPERQCAVGRGICKTRCNQRGALQSLGQFCGVQGVCGARLDAFLWLETPTLCAQAERTRTQLPHAL